MGLGDSCRSSKLQAEVNPKPQDPTDLNLDAENRNSDAAQSKPVRTPYHSLYWVAVKELNLSYYVGETLLFTIYTHYGSLI